MHHGREILCICSAHHPGPNREPPASPRVQSHVQTAHGGNRSPNIKIKPAIQEPKCTDRGPLDSRLTHPNQLNQQLMLQDGQQQSSNSWQQGPPFKVGLIQHWSKPPATLRIAAGASGRGSLHPQARAPESTSGTSNLTLAPPRNPLLQLARKSCGGSDSKY